MSDMKSTLASLKSQGYWVFHFKPTRSFSLEDKNYEALQQIVHENAVQLRGWDVPHVPTSSAEHQDLYNIDEGIEAWCDFGMQKEVWRLFFDGEFVSYVALDEDWFGNDDWLKNQQPYVSVKPGTILNPIGSVIFELTEIMVFVKRLVVADFIKGDVKVHIELRNVQGRRLDLLDPGRVPFHTVYSARQNEITVFDEVISSKDLRQQSTKLATKAALKVLNMFQWNSISPEQIADEQEKLFKRQF